MPANNPKVKKMIDGWLTFAKKNGIATPSTPGRNAEDKDVLEFIHLYISTDTGVTLQPEELASIEAIINKVPGGVEAPINTSALNRIKALIKNKLSDSQKRQLRRELVHG
jgi:hypothetical protein